MQLDIQGVTKEFSTASALHGVDLSIRAGELIALLGPSGSGKTTLLRIIAGLDFPSAGRVFFGGEDASAKPVQQRRVGFVFQHYALFRHMTVAENVAFGLRARPRRQRPPACEIARRVTELLALMQLPDISGRFPSQLSGGQRQRVAFARALASEPQVLLLDEPFGALDAKVRRDLRRWLREIHERTGHTTVFVTHDQDEALEVADRVVVMKAGRIEQVGAPDEIYDTPATPFVFDFIGESSHFDAEVRAGTPHLAQRPLLLPFNDLPDGRSRVYFRPHDAGVTRPAAGLIEGTITSLRRAGAIRRLELSIGPGLPALEADLPEGDNFRIGERAALDLRRARAFPLPLAA